MASGDRANRLMARSGRAAIIIMTAAMATPAPADDRVWLGNTGLWNAPGNWNPAVPPGPADRVVFNAATSSDAQFTNSVDIDTLDVLDGTVHFVSTEATVWTLRATGLSGMNIAGGCLTSTIAIDCDQTLSVDGPFEMNGATLDCLKLFVGIN